MKGKFIGLLILLGFVPVLIVGGAAVFSMLNQTSKIAQPPAPPPPDLNTAQAKMTQAADALLKGIQSTVTDVQNFLPTAGAAEFQAFAASHPGVSLIFHLSANGGPIEVHPPGAPGMDSTYAATEEFLNIRERAADPNNPWPYQFYSRRAGAAFVFVQKMTDGTFIGTQLDIGFFFQAAALPGSESMLMDADSGKIFYHSDPIKMDLPFNPAGEAHLTALMSDLQAHMAGTKATPASAAVFAPLGVGSFGLVQLIPLQTAAAAPAKGATAEEGLTLDKILSDPASLGQNPVIIAILGAIGYLLVMGFILLGKLSKPIKTARKVLETAASGQGKISEEALKKVKDPEVVGMLVASSQWAERLEREREGLGRQKDDEIHRVQGQLQLRAKELADVTQKLGDTKTVAEEKAQQLEDKLKEINALKGMAEGLRNQAEQARGEIAKMKTQMSSHEADAKKAESHLRQQLEQQAKQAEIRMKELESRLLQVVAAASSINVSKVRVAAVKTMAEELKTTLGIIKGYVSSALGSAQGGITEKQQEFLGMVINRSARLEKFINDLVDIFQVEIEQETAVRDSVSLASEIEGLAFNFQPQADIKSIKIRVEEKAPTGKVPIVRRRFTQLWNILYLQIIKDAPRGSQVLVTVEPVGEDAKVTVLDPGLTVKPEHLPRVFDEFYDPKHPASPQLAGTGLKFALVKTILAAHGGGAMAEKADMGTKLILTFPTTIKKKEDPAAAMAASMKSFIPAAPTGGLLGAVKPGVVAQTPHAPIPTGTTPLSPAKPPLTRAGLESLMSGVPGGLGTVKPAIPAKAPLPLNPTPRAPIPVGGMDAILGAKPPVTPPLARPMTPQPPKPIGAAGSPAPMARPIPPPSMPPSVPPAPRIVPTTMKPTTPPPGILNLDNQDGFKTDADAIKPPAPSPPSKPILNDLDKDSAGGAGELIE